MAQKQFNSPMAMYSEEALEEIMTEGTLGYVIDFSNLNCIYLSTFKVHQMYLYTVAQLQRKTFQPRKCDESDWQRV